MSAAIVAAAESDKIGYIEEGTTALNLHIEAIRNVCAEAGISPGEIEGVFATNHSNLLAEYLGIHPKYIDTTSVGHWTQGAQFGGGPYGAWGPPSYYAHALTRHMHEWGSTKEDFAEIAVVTREWAGLNPRAVMHSKETNKFGGPITVQDVMDSRSIVYPLNLLDICLVTDHGGAVLIASAEKARSFKTPPVWLAGAGENQSHADMLEMDDFTATSAAASAQAAYRMAGMGPGDMEMAMIYDSFTVTAGITAEMLGLTPRGEGPSLWANGNASPGGKFPVNTNGGGLSFSHSGMYGMMLLIEAYRQLSGTAEDGVHGIEGKQTSAQSAVVNGTGGLLSVTGTLVMTSDV
jgi:acetyl-CoA acetyltransferase